MSFVGFPTFTGGAGANSVKAYINGVDVTSYTQRTVNITRVLGGQASCTFDMYDPVGPTAIPQMGQDIKIIEFGQTRFAGKIDTVAGMRKTEIQGDTNAFYQVKCLDYSSILVRRRIIQTYPAGSITKDVYWDIIDSFATGEGITHFGVDGFSFLTAPMVFDYCTVADALNQMRDATGEDWWVDFNRDLHTHAFLLFPAAPFSITESSGNWRALTATQTTAGYRNKQYVRSNVNLAVGGFSDTFTGDGSTFFFVTRFPTVSAPQVTLNGVQQTVYALGLVPFGMPGVYYIPNGFGIQFSPQVGPSVGAVIVVTYGTFFSNVIYAQNTAEQATRAAAEGGTGIYEDLYEAKDLNSDAATLLAQGLLTRSGSIPTAVQYETLTPGLDVGMLQTVNVPIVGVNLSMVVTEIDSTEEPVTDLGNGSRFRHSVKLSSNLDQGGTFEKWMERYQVRTAQGQVAPTPEIHVWDLGMGGDLVLGADWTNILLAAIHFQNSGLLINTTVTSRVTLVGQDLYLRVMQGFLTDGSDGVTIYGKTDASNLVLKHGVTGIRNQSAFTPSPLRVIGANDNPSGATQFTIQGKYVPVGGAATVVNAQDVLVEMMLQY